MKPAKIVRRTFADIGKLSMDELALAMETAGLRPVEFVTVDHDAFHDHVMPRLEPWQVYDWQGYAARTDVNLDPFVVSYYQRNPPDDLRTLWRKQIFQLELHAYVEALSRARLLAQLLEVTSEKQHTPGSDWDAEQLRAELRARITENETTTPSTKPRRK